MNAGNTLSSNNNLAAYYPLNKQETVNNNNTTNTDSNESNLNKIGNGMFRSLMSLTRAESNLPQSSASEQQINDTMNSELNVNSFDQESDEYENLNQDNSESKPTFPSLTSSLNNNSGNNVSNNNNTRNINSNSNNENNNGNNNTNNNNGSNSANTPQRQIASSKDRLPSTVELSSALGIPIKHKPRRVWTPEEDAKLRTLVAEWGDQRGKNSHWDKISESMPGRTGKDCRKRWFHSLDPTLKRGRWTEDEDRILQEAYKELGPLWNRIAQLIPGRTDDQCSKRYNDVLDPRVQTRLRGWTKEEDDLLMEMCKTHGTQWKVIAAHLPGRTGLTCRNRWRKLAASKLQWNNQGNRKRMPKGGKANNKQNNATKSNDEEEELEEDENSNDNDNESELSSTLTKDSDTKMMDVTNNNNSKPDNANNLSVSDLSLNSRISYGSKVPSNFSRYGNSESNIRAQQQQQQQQQSSSMQNDYPTGSTPLPLDESFSLMQSSEAQALFQNVTGLSNSMPQSPLPFRNNNTSNSKMSNSNNTIDSTTTTTNYSFSLDNRSGQLSNSNSSTSRNNTNSDVGDLANETHAIKREDIEVLVKIAKENGVGIIIHQNNYHTHQHQHIHYYDRNEGNFERDDYNSINNSNKNNNSNNNEENRSNAQRQYVGLNNLLNSPTNTTSANRNSSNSNQKNNNNSSSNDQRTVPYIQTHPHFKELEQIDMDPEPFRYISLYPTPATNNSNNNNNTSTSTHAGGYGGTPSSSSQYSPLSYEGIPFNPS